MPRQALLAALYKGLSGDFSGVFYGGIVGVWPSGVSLQVCLDVILAQTNK